MDPIRFFRKLKNEQLHPALIDPQKANTPPRAEEKKGEGRERGEERRGERCSARLLARKNAAPPKKQIRVMLSLYRGSCALHTSIGDNSV